MTPRVTRPGLTRGRSERISTLARVAAARTENSPAPAGNTLENSESGSPSAYGEWVSGCRCPRRTHRDADRFFGRTAAGSRVVCRTSKTVRLGGFHHRDTAERQVPLSSLFSRLFEKTKCCRNVPEPIRHPQRFKHREESAGRRPEGGRRRGAPARSAPAACDVRGSGAFCPLQPLPWCCSGVSFRRNSSAMSTSIAAVSRTSNRSYVSSLPRREGSTTPGVEY